MSSSGSTDVPAFYSSTEYTSTERGSRLPSTNGGGWILLAKSAPADSNGETTVADQLASVQYARFADDMVILIGAAWKTDWLAGVVDPDEDGSVLTGSALGANPCDREPWVSLGRSPFLLETSQKRDRRRSALSLLFWRFRRNDPGSCRFESRYGTEASPITCVPSGALSECTTIQTKDPVAILIS